MKYYIGTRKPHQTSVEVVLDGRQGKEDIQPLNLRLDLYNHSPDGFEWGYGGSGPAQLALALLADATGNDEIALKLHQRYKFDVISRLGNPWIITQAQIRLWVSAQGKDK